MDINASGAMQNDAPAEKVEAVLGDYRKSTLFSRRERLALELAERVTHTKKRVTDKFFARLKRHFTEEELVELAAVIRQYGQEQRASRIARAIVRARPIGSTSELARVVRKASGPGRRLDPATKTFQGLRIAVNNELGNIEAALEQATGLLAPEGRLVALSYHSLEDGLVKRYLRREASDCICPPETPVCICGHKATLRLISRRARRPTEQEVLRNPRSRSARLRTAERLAPAPRV